MSDSDRMLDDILSQTVWLRRLARSLVTHEAERDDVVQQAWVEALQRRRQARALRPWMFGLVRNVARMELRREARRRRREEIAPVADPPARPDELVERVELERHVAAALLQIDEPYRSTMLMRYYDDLSPSEIARRLGVPAGTVRWRLKEGLERLRVGLDREFGGDRRRWGLALIPTAAAARGGVGALVAATLTGALVMKAGIKVAAGLVVLALVVFGGARLWRAPGGSTEVAHMSSGAPWRGVAAGRSAAVVPSATLQGVTVPLWFGQRGAPVRRIAGRVTLAGAPVQNATVELASALSDAGVVPVNTRRTGRDGAFDFGPQPPARYTVAASASRHSPAVREVDTRDPGSPAEHIELALGGCDSSILGHVADSSGGPVAAARVCHAPPRAAACVVSDADGRYEMCLSARQNAVEVSAKGYGAVDERLLFSGRRMRRDFLLTPEATVLGRVVRADNGAAIAGAEVNLVGVDQFSPRWSASAATVSGADGRFTLGGLAPGRVRLRATAEGAASSEWLELTAQAGRVTGEISIRLSPSARVSGAVTDGHDPVAGATVRIRGAIPSDAVTQSDGSFVLANVPRGAQALEALPYEVREPRSIIVDGAAVAGVRIVVAPMASIAGHVTREGASFGGAEVTAGRNTTTFTDGRRRLCAARSAAGQVSRQRLESRARRVRRAA